MRWIKRSYPRESGFLEAVVETLTETTENMGSGQGYAWWTRSNPWPHRQDPQPKGDGSHWSDYV